MIAGTNEIGAVAENMAGGTGLCGHPIIVAGQRGQLIIGVHPTITIGTIAKNDTVVSMRLFGQPVESITVVFGHHAAFVHGFDRPPGALPHRVAGPRHDERGNPYGSNG